MISEEPKVTSFSSEEDSEGLVRQNIDSNDFVWLSSEVEIDPMMFGHKAGNLCTLGSVGRHVPPGFAISNKVVSRIARGVQSAEESSILRWFYGILMDDTGGPLIVRSSSIHESFGRHSFAGIFSSHRDVCSLHDLYHAISLCSESASSKRARSYYAISDGLPNDSHMGIIVQSQIEFLVTALIELSRDDYTIELYDGDLDRRIKGIGRPVRVVSSSRRDDVVDTKDSLMADVVMKLKTVLAQLEYDFDEFADGSKLLIEAGYSDGDIYILQVNNLIDNILIGVQNNFISSHHTFHDRGLKANAMRYFANHGLFGFPVSIIDYNDSDQSIKRKLNKFEDIYNNGFTVRYSIDRNVSLPRHFVESFDDLFQFVKTKRQSKWSCIVHPFIDVKHSYELLLDNDSYVLEHIPGIWESDNRMDPDVVMAKDGSWSAYLVQDLRQPVFRYPRGEETSTQEPLTEKDVRELVDEIEPLLQTLRGTFSEELPLNFHFVTDDVGRLHFLNLRAGFEMPCDCTSLTNAFVVSDGGDVEQWDRKRPILLRITANRGDEADIVEIGKSIPTNTGMPIVIDFGMLSHPAIILREMGHKLIPSYLCPDAPARGHYVRVGGGIDIGMDPIERIRREPAVYSDEQFRIVRDKDPIVDGHLLLVAENEVMSLSETDLDAIMRRLLDGDLGNGKEFGPVFLAERGRARFCTSGFTKSHGHAHVLPMGHFESQTFEGLVRHVEASEYPTLAGALDEAALSGEEYVLLVDPEERVYLHVCEPGESVGKRTIRTFLSRHVV